MDQAVNSGMKCLIGMEIEYALKEWCMVMTQGYDQALVSNRQHHCRERSGVWY